MCYTIKYYIGGYTMKKDVLEFKGRYYVDNYGNVYNNVKRLKQNIDKDGYKTVTLWKDNKPYFRRVHRLVAEAFIPNPDNKPQVNHIDECKTNNFVSNLEWSTHKENINHGTRTKRQIETQQKTQKSKQIICSNGIEYDSIRACARDLKLDNGSIVKVLKGKRKACGGYTFKYKEVK